MQLLVLSVGCQWFEGYSTIVSVNSELDRLALSLM